MTLAYGFAGRPDFHHFSTPPLLATYLRHAAADIYASLLPDCFTLMLIDAIFFS
jgi:hypothetical protein